MPGLHGDLSVMVVADLLIWLGNRRMTGFLTVEHGDVRKDFAVEDGHAVRASSTSAREGFGQFLVNSGLINEDQLQSAFELQGNALLGRTLVKRGLVQESEIGKALDYHIRETLLDAMRWTAGVFIFDARIAASKKPRVEVAVPLVELHQEAGRRSALWQQYQSIFPSKKMILSVNDLMVPPNLDAFTQGIVRCARAGLTIEAIALELHSPDYPIYAGLFDLFSKGALQALEPSGRRYSEPSPFDVDIDDSVDLAETAQQLFEDENFEGALQHAQAASKSEPADTTVGTLSREAAARLAEQLEETLPSTDAVPILTRSVSDISGERRLNAKENYIASRIDGRRSIRAIMQVSPMRDVDALIIFQKWFEEGLIRLEQHSTPPAA